QKTYSTKDSRVVTHRSTNLAIRSLTLGERTGSRILFYLWPYVQETRLSIVATCCLPILKTNVQNVRLCTFVACCQKLLILIPGIELSCHSSAGFS
ncbi:hypothetical protein BJ508DRAFT_213488, partial [Ascobolus immersus RN42]